MTNLRPTLKKLRILAGEGDFHCYRLLKLGRRGFLFSKYLLTTLSYFKGTGGCATTRTIAFVKGGNQLRYHRHVAEQLESDFGEVQLFTSSRLSVCPASLMLPRLSVLDVLLQFYFLLLTLLTGRRRYLNLYFLAFEAAIVKTVGTGFQAVETLICYNDQPYDVAAILHALHDHDTCRTIVIQHGLVLSEKFYFPSIAREFWAWGELSRTHYCARDQFSRILIKGRYNEDVIIKRDNFIVPGAGKPLRILVAPSYFHDEVKQTLESLGNMLSGEFGVKASVAIKFHPSTKFAGLLKLWCVRCAPWMSEEIEPMEELADKYDVLVTKNSTSAVDFLLRGKPVFFLEPRSDEEFPSISYGFKLEQLSPLLTNFSTDLCNKNASREKFLRLALNV